MGEGEDVSNWVEKYDGTKERLLALALEAKIYRKQKIIVNAGEIGEVARKIEHALITVQDVCPLLNRAGKLVQPLWHKVRDRDGREVKLCKLEPIRWRSLRELADYHAAEFYHNKVYKDGTVKEIRCDPPVHIIQTIIDREHGSFPDVVGLINSPTMRADGSLITEEGYDEATQLYHKPADETLILPDIPEKPSRPQAEAALKRLEELVSECHFVAKGAKGVDQSVAVAAMMTTVLRGAFPFAPIFLFHKPEPGTGASYLANIISVLATGHESVPLAANNDNPAEFYKELCTACVLGRPILNLNNLIADLKSPLLSQMVTEVNVELRRFGKNDETIHCDCRAMTILANGNNIQVVGELVRRTLTCRLDAKTEYPETLTYKTPTPIQRIKKDRGRYLADIFTILRAYRSANKETKGIHLAGFEEWAKIVQHPLIWLDRADPVKSLEKARVRDPDRSGLRERLSVLFKHFKNNEFIAADIYERAIKTEATASGRFINKNQDLFDAFSENGRLLGTKLIGKQLMKDEDRKWDECYLELVSESSKTSNSYRVVGKPPGATDPEAWGPDPATPGGKRG